MKAAGRFGGAVPESGALSDPAVQSAVVAWELLLGGWLVSGWGRPWAWLVATATFVLFGTVSLWRGLGGVADCGCFGVVKASPWAALAVDAAALGLLAVARPKLAAFARPVVLTPALRHGAGVLAVLTVALAAGSLWAGSPRAMVARLRGEAVSAPGYVDFGAGTAGDRLTANATISNFSDRPLMVVGGSSDCSCTTTESLPLTIPPNDSADVPIRLTLPASTSGQFTRNVVLWTDGPGQPVLRLRIGARVE